MKNYIDIKNCLLQYLNMRQKDSLIRKAAFATRTSEEKQLFLIAAHFVLRKKKVR
jgi:hypothetical protein